MGTKQQFNEVFKKYASNNHKSASEDYEIESRIGYMTEVLAGNRRKKEHGGYWRWEDRLKETKRALNELSRYSLNETEVNALRDIQSVLKNNDYINKKKKDAAVKEGLSNVYSHIDNYIALYNKIKEVRPEKEVKQKLRASLEERIEPVIQKGSALDKFVKSVSGTMAGLVIAGTLLGTFIGYNAGHKNAQQEYSKQKPKIVYISQKQEAKKSAEEKLYDSIAKQPAEKDKKDSKISRNNGIFPQGYCYKKDISEYPAGKTKHNLFDEQARDIKESTIQLWHEDVRKHPRANDRYNHIKGKSAFDYAGKNLLNTLDYIAGDGPDIKQNLFGNEEPLISKNYEVSLKEAILTGDEGHQRVDGLISDLTSIGNKHKATPNQMIKKTGDDASKIIPSAGKFIKNFFTLNWFGKRTVDGKRESGAIENLVDTAVYTVKTPLDIACVPLQAVPIIDANGLVEDTYHSIRAVRGTFGSAAATVVNTSQGVVDGVAVKPIKAILPPLGRGIDKVNIAAHDTAQFATTGISQLFEAELLAENIDPQEQTTIWESDPAKADRAIYPYRQPTGMRYLYEAGKDIAAGIVISNVINGGGKDGGINNSGGNEPGRSGGPGTGLGAPGRTGGPGTP